MFLSLHHDYVNNNLENHNLKPFSYRYNWNKNERLGSLKNINKRIKRLYEILFLSITLTEMDE